jgi:hypothetical protein
MSAYYVTLIPLTHISQPRYTRVKHFKALAATVREAAEVALQSQHVEPKTVPVDPGVFRAVADRALLIVRPWEGKKLPAGCIDLSPRLSL